MDSTSIPPHGFNIFPNVFAEPTASYMQGANGLVRHYYLDFISAPVNTFYTSAGDAKAASPSFS